MVAIATPFDPTLLNSARPVTGLPAGVRDRLARLSELIGLPLACVDGRSGHVLAQTSVDWLPFVPSALVALQATVEEPVTIVTPTGLLAFSIPLTPHSMTPILACGYLRADHNRVPTELISAGHLRGWGDTTARHYAASLPVCPQNMFQRVVTLANEQAQPAHAATAAQQDQLEMQLRLDNAREEIELLHTLTHNMHLSRSPADLVGLTLTRLTAAVPAAMHLIWLDLHEGEPLFRRAGEALVDEHGLARLVSRFDDERWHHALVKNNIGDSLLGSDFPGLENFCLVPILEGTRRYGWLMTANLTRDPEFSSTHSSLLASVATLLATHNRNVDLYTEHEDLLLSFVRSLVSSLDAKDQYTRGHSERVALIAQRIGREMRLPEDDLRDIYLSGLLHDIGKIGVNDEIIQKPGNLTADEFEQIKRHPIIGYNILAGLKNLKRVLPGVRNHHEQYSGSGYPDRLAGDAIPMMARIMAVADSYDAMGSDRPYRKGMPLDKLEAILQSGAGNQWDPRVVAAYFACRESIAEICRNYDLEDGAILTKPEFEGGLSRERNDLTTASLRAALYAVAAG